jgi:hypothetical protein
LGGILTALDWAQGLGEARVLTVAVDTPFLPADLVERLMATWGACGCAAPMTEPMRRPGIWSVDLREGCRSRVDGVRKVRDWTASVGAETGDVRRRRRLPQRQHAGRPRAGGGGSAVTGFDTIVVADWSARSTPSPARPSKDAIFLGICRDRYVATLYQRTRSQAMRNIRGLIDGDLQGRAAHPSGFRFPFAYPRGLGREPYR